MQKHLFWYPWVCAAMIAGILVCAALILRLLLNSAPEAPEMAAGVYLVREAMQHAAL